MNISQKEKHYLVKIHSNPGQKISFNYEELQISIKNSIPKDIIESLKNKNLIFLRYRLEKIEPSLKTKEIKKRSRGKKNIRAEFAKVYCTYRGHDLVYKITKPVINF